MNLLAEIAHLNPDPALLLCLEDALKKAQQDALIVTQKTAQITALEIKANIIQAALKISDTKNAALSFELAYYRRLHYGKKSEALTSTQKDLFDETEVADIAAIHIELDQLKSELAGLPAQPKLPRHRAGRQPLPAHLERIVHHHDISDCACGQCGKTMHKIGEDITEQLDVEPARFYVHQHIRATYACRACEVIQTPAVPAAIIDGGSVAPGLLAYIATCKFLDHLPLYRIEEIAQRQNVHLPRSNLANWIGHIGVALQPLAERLSELLKQGTCLHADETPVQQLDPGQGKTKRAYLWAYRSNALENDPPLIVFDYQTSRAGQHATHFLQGWQGHLMVDGYAGYKALFKTDIIELGCWAHARRKFHELWLNNQSKIGEIAVHKIATLYKIEQEAKDHTPEQRLALRQAQAQTQLEDLRSWLINTRLTIAEGSATAKAMDYTLKRWDALARYANTGHLPIDNNPIENAIRPIAIGKKNWLFAGSERAGKRAATIQSLFATAKANHLDPHAWLKDTLEKLPTWPNSRIDELLPLRRNSTSS